MNQQLLPGSLFPRLRVARCAIFAPLIPLIPLIIALLAASPLLAGSVEVKIKLPQHARLDMQGRKSIAVAPFIVVSKEGEKKVQGRTIDVQKEFHRYLLKVLRRETELKVIETGPVEFPVYDPNKLSLQGEFWHALGERTAADLIISGDVDFDIQDRTGYRTEQYTSPFDGQTYTRQVLVDQTGFEYDILLQVYDGKTGALVYEDNFKDFQTFEGQNADPLKGMFENLLALENRILNVFTQKEVEARRILFTQ